MRICRIAQKRKNKRKGQFETNSQKNRRDTVRARAKVQTIHLLHAEQSSVPSRRHQDFYFFLLFLSHTHIARTVKLCKPVGWLPSAPLVKLNKHNGTKKEKQHVCRQSGSLAFHLHFSSSLSRQAAWESTVSPSPSVTVLTPKPPPAWKAEPYSPSVVTCHKSTETSNKYQ